MAFFENKAYKQEDWDLLLQKQETNKKLKLNFKNTNGM